MSTQPTTRSLRSFGVSRRGRRHDSLKSESLAVAASPLAIAIACTWLALAMLVCLFAGSEFSWRNLACAIAVLLIGGSPVRTTIALRGRRAVRSIEWSEEGALWVRTVGERQAVAAELTGSAAQLGARWIWFAVATPRGRLSALLDRSALPREQVARLVWVLRSRQTAAPPACGREAAKLLREI